MLIWPTLVCLAWAQAAVEATRGRGPKRRMQERPKISEVEMNPVRRVHRGRNHAELVTEARAHRVNSGRIKHHESRYNHTKIEPETPLQPIIVQEPEPVRAKSNQKIQSRANRIKSNRARSKKAKMKVTTEAIKDAPTTLLESRSTYASQHQSTESHLVHQVAVLATETALSSPTLSSATLPSPSYRAKPVHRLRNIYHRRQHSPPNVELFRHIHERMASIQPYTPEPLFMTAGSRLGPSLAVSLTRRKQCERDSKALKSILKGKSFWAPAQFLSGAPPPRYPRVPPFRSQQQNLLNFRMLKGEQKEQENSGEGVAIHPKLLPEESQRVFPFPSKEDSQQVGFRLWPKQPCNSPSNLVSPLHFVQKDFPGSESMYMDYSQSDPKVSEARRIRALSPNFSPADGYSNSASFFTSADPNYHDYGLLSPFNLYKTALSHQLSYYSPPNELYKNISDYPLPEFSTNNMYAPSGYYDGYNLFPKSQFVPFHSLDEPLDTSQISRYTFANNPDLSYVYGENRFNQPRLLRNTVYNPNKLVSPYIFPQKQSFRYPRTPFGNNYTISNTTLSSNYSSSSHNFSPSDIFKLVRFTSDNNQQTYLNLPKENNTQESSKSLPKTIKHRALSYSYEYPFIPDIPPSQRNNPDSLDDYCSNLCVVPQLMVTKGGAPYSFNMVLLKEDANSSEPRHDFDLDDSETEFKASSGSIVSDFSKCARGNAGTLSDKEPDILISTDSPFVTNSLFQSNSTVYEGKDIHKDTLPTRDPRKASFFGHDTTDGCLILATLIPMRTRTPLTAPPGRPMPSSLIMALPPPKKTCIGINITGSTELPQHTPFILKV